MILYQDIYDRAVHLFDDPDILRAYSTDKIKFQKIMHPYLLNGVSTITMPTGVSALLAEQSSPEGKLELFDGDGTATYFLSTYPPLCSTFRAYIGSDLDANATYDPTTNAVTFSQAIPTESACSFEWYYAGAFTGDFSSIAGRFPVNALISRTIDLLVRVTVISWADKEQNFLLDIRNILTDTDFKRSSPAASLTAKKGWVESLRQEIFNLQNKLDWDLRNQNRSHYGY